MNRHLSYASYAALVLGVLTLMAGWFFVAGLMLGTSAVAWRLSGERVPRVSNQKLQEIEDYANRKDGESA